MGIGGVSFFSLLRLSRAFDAIVRRHVTRARSGRQGAARSGRAGDAVGAEFLKEKRTRRKRRRRRWRVVGEAHDAGGGVHGAGECDGAQKREGGEREKEKKK